MPPHTLQQYGLSPMCVFIWVVKSEYRENDDAPTSKENGFPPVWIYIRVVKQKFCGKVDHPLPMNMVSVLCEFGFFKNPTLTIRIHTLYKNMVFLLCVFAYGSLN